MDNLVTTFCLIVTVHGQSLEPLIETFDDPTYLVRHKQTAVLKKQLQVPWEEFLIKGLKKERKTLEVHRRVENLIKKWDSFTTEYGNIPWIDALPNNFPDRQRIMSEYLGKASGCYGNDYPQYRLATSLWLQDLKSQGWWMSCIWRLQEEMIPNEKFWKQNGRFPP